MSTEKDADGGACEPPAGTTRSRRGKPGTGRRAHAAAAGDRGRSRLAALKSQWLRGAWEELAGNDPGTLERAPERALASLLIGAAHLQLGRAEEARPHIARALEDGCPRRMVAEVLLAGLHNSMARAFALTGDEERMQSAFRYAVAPLAAEANPERRGIARAAQELLHMGLWLQAADLLAAEVGSLREEAVESDDLAARIRILESEVELLHHRLSIAQQRHQLYRGPHGAAGAEDLATQSVSQLGQDLWVLEKTGYKHGGYFVEFGASDGISLSNSLLLEQAFAWDGICAEPNPKLYQELKRNRRCKVSDRYIGGESGTPVEFILAGTYGGAREYAGDDAHGDKREAYRQAGHVTTLSSISLDAFLKENGAPRDIDYLSIDTEGSELEILSRFPFDEWNVRLLTIEHNYTDRRGEIRALMERNGYRCTEREWEDWYEKVP